MLAERELSQFVRKLMCFVYPPSVIPAEFEVRALLTPVDCEYATVDEGLYNLHFGQYFRYDVRTQLPFFYRSVQKLMGVVCREVTGAWEQGAISHFSMTPFDPELIHRGSDDRCIDALVGTCATLSRYQLLDDDDVTAVLRQYREVTQFFKKKWTLTENAPVVDDVVTMWFSYPYWSRCQELLTVVNILFGLNAVGTYELDFVDDVDVAMPEDTLRSSLHFVRSWLAKSYAGHTLQTLTGLLRVCETSDMQVTRLSDEARSRPWDQLMKSGLGEALARGNATLSNELSLPTTVRIDDYRSNVLAQLDLVEVLSPPRAGRRSSPVLKRGTSVKKVVRRQEDVTLPASGSTPIRSLQRSRTSIRKNVKSAVREGPSTSRQSSGRRTGGKPRGKKFLQLATVGDSDNDSANEVVVSGKKRQSRCALYSSDEQD